MARVDSIKQDFDTIIRRNVERHIEATDQFNADQIMAALQYNFKSMNYLVAQGKSLANDHHFKFLAAEEDEYLKIFPNRRGKETLLMMQPRGQYRASSKNHKKDDVLIQTPK